jgi:hypothetical protein
MNCNLLHSDRPNIYIAQLWRPIEQLQPNKATKYQTSSLYDLLNHGYKYISTRPVGNNAAWRRLLADNWLTGWHVTCLCCVERCCALWSKTVKEKMHIIFWEEIFFWCFNERTKRRTGSKNTKLLPTIWDIVTASVCSFHQSIIRLRSRNIPLKIRVTTFNIICADRSGAVKVNIGT